MSILLIGYGSTLRSDDGVGQVAARAAASWDVPGVRALARHQLTPELAEDLAAADLAVFVDAAADTRQSDVVVTELRPREEASVATHSVAPDALLALARLLYGSSPRAFLVTVPVATFELGEALSPKAELGLAAALVRVRELIGAPPESAPASTA